jgi:hypothetical protein
MATQSRPPAAASVVPGGFKYDSSIADTRSDRPVGRFALTLNLREQIERAILQQEIYVTKTESFSVTFLNIFDRYILPHITTDATVQDWKAHPMTKWQNQLNFAVWCASAGCGVGLTLTYLATMISLWRPSFYAAPSTASTFTSRSAAFLKRWIARSRRTAGGTR